MVKETVIVINTQALIDELYQGVIKLYSLTKIQETTFVFAERQNQNQLEPEL